MRAFIALPLPAEVKAHLAIISDKLDRTAAGSMRWVKSEQIHLTLKFLGEIDDGKVPAISAELKRIAPEFAPWRARLTGVGGFPGGSSPRVIWVGLEDGGTSEVLSSRVEEAMESLGFERESRAFTPHLTLGRRKPGRKSGGIGRESFGRIIVEPIEFVFSRIVLFQSTLLPTGAVHREVSAHSMGS
ncbi:MAG: RNA 2',3'-cyclic phosphodiesterase [Acidobacteriota bacterium]